MAVTTIPQNLVEKAWAKETWTAALNNIFFAANLQYKCNTYKK